MTDSDGVQEKLERIEELCKAGWGDKPRDNISAIRRATIEALALLKSEPSVRIFTWDDLEKANDARIRATNREPDLRPDFVGQLQIAMEAMGLRVVISPPLECVEAYKRDAGIPTESKEPSNE